MIMEDQTKDEEMKDIPPIETTDCREFEDIIEELGSFGHWQRVIFVLISLMDVYGSMSMMIPVFTGATPRWRCQSFINYSESINSSNAAWGMCEYNGSKCEAMVYDDQFTSIVSQWNLVCDRSYISDLVTSVQMSGLVLGAAAFGQLSDTIGRKKSYYIAFTIMIGCGGLSAASVNWQMYAALRFFVGIGFAGTMVVNCAYTIEFVGKRWRTICGAVGFWAFGSVLIAFLAYFIRSWRYLTLASTVSGIIYYVTLWIVPESPRWLAQKGRLDECQAIVSKIAKMNNRPTPAMSILQQYMQTDAARRESQKRYTYWDLFRVWYYCRRTLILMMAWFSMFAMYYHLTYNIKNLSGDRYVNVLYASIVDCAALLSIIVVNNILGRRVTFTLVTGIAFCCNMGMVFIHVAGKQESLLNVIRGGAMIGKGACLTALYCLQIYTAELFPTAIRNVALGAISISGRIGSIMSPQMVYLGTQNVLAPYIVFSILGGLTLPLVIFLPETNGRALEDSFDSHGGHAKENKYERDNASETDVHLTKIRKISNDPVF